jgi:hypothetical protein
MLRAWIELPPLMAHYTRFEIYVPVIYRTKETDPDTGDTCDVTHALPRELLREFIADTQKSYGGITQANPVAPALYKGWWQKKRNTDPIIDYLTLLFGLVRIDLFDEAETFFSSWKQTFESATHQDVVLVIYYSVQTIGEL